MTLHEFRVPDIGEGLADVEIVEWHVTAGDEVGEHQIIASVETDKSVIEVPSPYAGTIREVRGEPGDRVPVGAVLVVIENDGPAVLMESPSTPQVSAETPSAGSPARVPASDAVPPSAGPGRGRAAPSVRRLARELGVELGAVVGTGPGGLVVADDVRAAVSGGAGPTGGPTADTAAGPRPEGREPERVPLRGLRRAVAHNMTAVAQVPHITSHREVAATNLLAWRRQENERREAPLTITPFLALCVMGALRAVPKLNAVFDPENEELIVHRAVHLGIATATDDGLLVPVVHDADLLDLVGLASAIEARAQGARARSLAPAELSGGTFTITNYGSNDGWFGTPLLRLPEIGIAGFGRIEPRPWVIDGELAVAPVLPISVSVDHRVIDGDVSGQFTKALASYLTDPLRLLSVASAWS